MNTNLEICIRNVYGTTKAYPHNAVAREFARIAGTVTLSAEVLKSAICLGFDIVKVSPAEADEWINQLVGEKIV